jgi:hypothetical protein
MPVNGKEPTLSVSPRVLFVDINPQKMAQYLCNSPIMITNDPYDFAA